MPDRNYIIEILLRARDDTARAFASATANLEAYDKLLDEQRAKTEAMTRAQQGYTKEFERNDNAMKQRSRSMSDLNLKNDESVKKLAELEAAQRAVTKAQQDGLGGSAQYAQKVNELAKAEKGYADQLYNQEQRTRSVADAEARAAAQRVASDERVKASVKDRAQAMADLDKIEQGIADNQKRRAQQQRQEDLAYVSSLQKRVSDAKKATEDEAKAEEDLARRIKAARADIDKSRKQTLGQARKSPITQETRQLAQQTLPGETRTPVQYSDLGGVLGKAQQLMKSLDTTTQGFDSHIRNAFGFGVVALIQPFIALMVGMAGTMGSIASAAAAAGTAISVSFVSAMAEGIPVMGLFGAAMQRLTQIFSYVQAVQQQVQQRFLAQYQAAYQNSLGINQVTIATHNYSDALFAEQQAVRAVGESELALLAARQQATRQLQQLIFQEENAKLAAEASSLAVSDAQKALQEAIRTGGDVQQAQLQLQQAQVGHTQSVAQAQQAITDAASGSVARQQIAQQVSDAQNAVVQANRAVVDSQYAAAQARAAIIQAQQAAAGYNEATAAQLAWLRSQMTSTELSLEGNIQKIYQMFQGVHGYMRPITDAILGAFIPLTGQIIKTLQDPAIFRALLNLGKSMGSSIRSITNVVFSPASVRGFVTIINDAARNLGPLAKIAGDMFKVIQAVVIAAGPSLSTFLGNISSLAGQLASWASSSQGQNWLATWFNQAFSAANAFVNLGVAIIKLILAIVSPQSLGGAGGGQSGINVIQTLTGWVNSLTKSIHDHGSAFKDLQVLWKSAVPALNALKTIFGALFHALVQLTGTPQGQAGLKSMAYVIANVLIPAFVIFATDIGKVTTKIGEFLQHHSEVSHMLAEILGVTAAVTVGLKGAGLVFGPIARIIGSLRMLTVLFGAVKTLLTGGGFSGFRTLVGGMPAKISEALKVGGDELATKIRRALGGSVNVGKGGSGKNVAGIFEGRGNSPELPLYVYVINEALGGPGNKEKVSGEGGGGGATSTAESDAKKAADESAKTVGKDVENDAKRGIRQAAADAAKTAGDHLARSLPFIGTLVTVVPALGAYLKLLLPGWTATPTPHPSLNFNQWPTLTPIGPQAPFTLPNANSAARQQAYARSQAQKYIPGAAGASAGQPGGSGILSLDFLHPLANTVSRTISNIKIKSDAKKLGEDTKSGYDEGVKGIDHTLPNYIVKSVNGVKEYLRIKSPSGVFITIGQEITAGLQQGLQGLQNTGSSIAQQILKGAQDNWQSISSIGAAINTWIKDGLQPTYSKVQYFGAWIIDNIYKGLQAEAQQRGIAGAAKSYVFDPIYNDFETFQAKFYNGWWGLWAELKSLYTNFWTTANKYIQQQLNTLYTNFKQTYTQVATDTFNEFWYINHVANQALVSFGAKPDKVTLAGQPKFAEGGWVGQAGEQGADLVHALLGRGEAVLNWGQQRIVEPAMRAFYGWGLGDMFNKVRGQHAGGFSGGYASGGYVWPFGGPVNWERTDQGVDFSMAPGTAIGPIGKARIAGVNQNWFQGQPFIWWELLDGPDKGKYAYVAEQITGLASPGAVLNANQAVAHYASKGTGIEYGFATSGGSTLARVTGGYTEGEVTGAGSAMRALLSALATGAHVPILGGALGSGQGASWTDIVAKAIHGTGVLADTLKAATKKVTAAANAFGQNAAGSAPGGGQAGSTAGLSGTLKAIVRQISSRMGWGAALMQDWLNVIGAESNGTITDTNPSSGAYGIAQMLAGSGGMAANKAKYYQYGGNPNTMAGQLVAMANYIKAQWGSPAAAWVNEQTKHWYAGGGIVGQPIPIIAHAGEWVLNQAQQSKVASWLGSSPGRIASALGFTGGPTEFQGGGVAGAGSSLSGAISNLTAAIYSILRAGVFNPSNRQLLPTSGSQSLINTTTGAFTAPTVQVDTPGFNAQAIAIYNRAQAIIVRKIETDGKNIAKGLSTFTNNFNAVGGDNGLFAGAAQAIQDFINQQASVVQLAAAGVRLINNQLRYGNAQTAVGAARTDLASTNTQINILTQNHRQMLIALRAINTQVKGLGDPRKLSGNELTTYQQLIGDRQQLITDLNTSDQNLSQAYSDRYTKAVTLLQAQNAQALRGTGTLSGGQIGATELFAPTGTAGGFAASFGNATSLIQQAAAGGWKKIGAQTASGVASMMQSIAQALGDPQQINTADAAVLQTAQATQAALQQQYSAAAAKAQKDPRWQSVADDLLAQLESATENVAQAMAQQLSDAISTQDTQTQMQQAAVSMQNTIFQTLGQMSSAFGSPAGQFAAIQGQIGISQGNAQAIQQQIGAYNALLGTAQAQGNVGAANQLIQTIDQLNATMVQANLQTQQLITSYYQLAATLQSSTTQAQGGFSGAASSIFQTLGSIQGSQMLPQLIQIATAAASAIQAQGQSAIGNINQVVAGGAGQAFGAASGTANQWLSAASGAFQQGPAAFATWLGQNAQGLAAFQAGLPQDEQTLFNNLIQALVDNTTASVNNTQQLQQLNATTNQQQFTSSAWTMFRTAIFNGIGGLLPQYAMTVPSMDTGGILTRSGLVFGHKDETIIPAGVSRTNVGGNITHNHNWNLTNPTEVADPVYLGNAVAWRLDHDPSTR